MHTCSQLVQGAADMEKGKIEVAVTRHKEEAPSRIASDALDRRKIIDKLQLCMDPISRGDDPDDIVNIVTRRLTTNNVNVDKSVDVWLSQMPSFEKSWPAGSYDSLSSRVVTIAANRKVVKVGSTSVCDSNFIFSRLLGLQQQSWNINIDESH